MNLMMRILAKSAKRSGVYYIDSTFLPVCKNQRIYRHKTFAGLAARGFSSCGWFYGFKLHLMVNHLGEPVSFVITRGNVSDQNMSISMSKDLIGLLFGDKGYLGAKTAAELLRHGLKPITKVKKNMKARPIPKTDEFLLRKRGIVETVFGQLKDFKHLVHTKYRSVINYFTNIVSSLLAYTLNPNKPRIELNRLGGC